MKIRFAVAPGLGAFDPAVFEDLIDSLEDLGFDGVWLSDVPLGATVDPGVGLAYAASRTRRLKLGANVVPIGRNPMLLAKELAQLDQLSRGRVLLSIVPGIDQPGEREALGIGEGNRGAYLDEVLPLLRRWWAGETVEHRSERFGFDFRGITVHPRPVQDPLELWLGGRGPAALRRAGRLGDGWLGAALPPAEAGTARERIEDAAREAGRAISPEHFGLSVPYAREEVDLANPAARYGLRPDVPVEDLLPVGRAQLRDLIGRHVDCGLSKFVVRPTSAVTSWRDELSWLADAILDLQT